MDLGERLANLGPARRWVELDVVIAVVMLAINVTAPARHGELTWATVVTATLMSALLPVRRFYPEAVVVVLLGVVTAYDLSHPGRNLPAEPVAIVFVYYMVGRNSVRRGWSIVDVALLLVPIPAIAANPSTANPGGSLVVGLVSVWLFFLVIPFGAGRAVSSWSIANEQLRERTEELDRDRRRRAEAAGIEERNRMAREIHDVVAHSLSVMVIQTAGARRVASEDRIAAIRALEAVGACGRDALADLRRMVGVVHRGEVELPDTALPGVGELATLASRASDLGLLVDLRIEGTPRPLSPALDLVIYRVVQEALTNAIKYAAPAKATVLLEFGADELAVRVTDSGRRTGPSAGGVLSAVTGSTGGQGVVGMHERVAVFGGRLRAGSLDGAGFEVAAMIPLDASVTQ